MSSMNWIEQLALVLNMKIKLRLVPVEEWNHLQPAGHTDNKGHTDSAGNTDNNDNTDNKDNTDHGNYAGNADNGIHVDHVGNVENAVASLETSAFLNGNGAGMPSVGDCRGSGDKHWFVVRTDKDGELLELLEVCGEGLTEKEKGMIGWALQNKVASGSRPQSGKQEQERLVEALGHWLQQQLAQEAYKSELPEALTFGGRLYGDMVPFLLISEQPVQRSSQRQPSAELDKLLKTFFAEEVTLIPLREQEWLILAPVALLKEAEQEDRFDEVEESHEELIASIGYGLQDMLASEWVGDCHLAAGSPITPAKSLVEMLALLRETIFLGRKFHVGDYVHLPWLLHLERLLNSIPESQRSRYIEQVLKRSDVMLEAEIVTTLDIFFSLDCNVSETAKRLYIHRNTLLYRLDKLKQETGLDVRQFRDAVLVRLIMLLYKVTKRQ